MEVPRLRSAAGSAPPDAAGCSDATRYADDARDAWRAPCCRSASSTSHGDVFGGDSSPVVVPLRGTAASSSSAAPVCA